MASLFVATPTYDEWVSVEHASSLFLTGAYLTMAGIDMQHGVAPGNPFLDAARNDLVEKFLASDATDLLFVDADVGWDAKVVPRLLSYPQEIVGGLVPKRDLKSDATFHQNALTGVMSPEGLFQALELPTAFMRIKRSAFDRLKAVGIGRDSAPFFKIGHHRSEFGEDIYFCRRWCELGQHVWIDSDITFTHRGGKAWKGNFYEHAISSGLLIKDRAA